MKPIQYTPSYLLTSGKTLLNTVSVLLPLDKNLENKMQFDNKRQTYIEKMSYLVLLTAIMFVIKKKGNVTKDATYCKRIK